MISVLPLLFIWIPLLATGDVLCEDIHHVACGQAKEGSADPSGKVLSAGEMTEKLDTLRKQFSPRLAELCKGALSADPALSRALSARLNCLSDCAKINAQALSALIERDTFGGEGRFSFHDLTVTDIYALTGHPGFIKLSGQIQGEFREAVAPKAKRDELEKNIFKEVRELAIARINKIQMDDGVRSRIVARLNKIEISAGECGLLKLDQLYPDTLSFSGLKNKIKICNAAVARVDSKIALVAMIAHELGHSFDPCHISDPKESIMTYVLNDPKRSRDDQFPLPKIVSCLREGRSISARPAKRGLECEHDQVNEGFADWFAAEIVPQFVAKRYPGATLKQKRAAYVNSLWRTCNDTSQQPQYPASELRGNALLAMNPLVREQLQCAKTHQYVYCDVPSLNAKLDSKSGSSVEAYK